MFRIDTDGNVGGMWDEGNPSVPRLPTQFSAEFMNHVQEELAAVVLAAGLTLDKTNRGQLLAALAVGPTLHYVGDSGEPAFNTTWSQPTSTTSVKLVYGKRRDGRVFVEGSADRTGVGASETLIFTLPVGYRPTGLIHFPAHNGSGSYAGVVINSSGLVQILNTANGPVNFEMHIEFDPRIAHP